MRRKALLLLALSLGTAQVAAKDAWVVWQAAGETAQVRTLEGSSTAPPATVPLGSLWKLFVFSFLQGTQANEPAYRCEATKRTRQEGDEYCCESGQSVARDAALARSCGRYFEPARLIISADEWRSYWLSKNVQAQWIIDLAKLKPDTVVPVSDVLDALSKIDAPTRLAARAALAPAALTTGGGNALSAWGSGPRFKTFSWQHPSLKGASIGGAAGWLADGTPFWLGGEGVSRDVVARLAPKAALVLPRAQEIARGGTCVQVDYLTRYPVKQVRSALQKQPITPGILNGRYIVELENGRSLPLSAVPAAGEIQLETLGSKPQLTGLFSLNEYVARVLDREANARQTQAAQALAVAARTYLIQNADFQHGCYRIADDSRTQRVSLNPASAAARAAALTTDDLILSGNPVRYHRDTPAPGVMSWQAAAQASDAGQNYVDILKQVWPQAQLTLLDGSTECKPMAAAHAWLTQALPQWRRVLAREPGFEVPAQWTVCELAHGNPYADIRRARIYTRHWQTYEGRLTLAHEFMHLVFANHPSGSDEAFAERWARRLVDPTALMNQQIVKAP